MAPAALRSSGSADKVRALAVALLVMAAILYAADAQQLQCSGAQKHWVVADLFFARNHVSDAGFARLKSLARYSTPGSTARKL